MTTTDFTFEPLPPSEVLAHRVYFRVLWTDDWTFESTLHCVSAHWNANPVLPTAVLTRRYGRAVNPGDATPTLRPRSEDNNRLFIKIEFDTISLLEEDPTVLKWYGVLEIDDNVIDGPIPTVDGDGNTVQNSSGRQHFQCYGLAHMLDRVIVNNSMIDQQPTGEVRLGRGLDFNFNGFQNKSELEGFRNAFIFSSDMDKTKRGWWNTHDAVQYLLAYHSPVSNTGAQVLKFELHDVDDALPAWDHVSLPTHGQSVWELLNALISRQRLLGFKIEPADDESKIYLIPFTFNTTDIVLPEIDDATITANPNQITIDADRAPDCAMVVKKSSVDAYDQVRIMGARRTTTCTLSFKDKNIQTGWSDAQKTEYDQGASMAGDYPAAAEVEERQWRNMEARKADKLKAVYAYFTLVTQWDGKAGSGTGTTQSPVFPSDDDPTVNATFYPPELFVLPRLNLLDGFDYSSDNLSIGPPSELSPGPHEKLRPVVLFPRYDAGDPPTKWRTIDDLGLGGNLETYGQEFLDTFSGRVEVPEDVSGLVVRVTNDEQYVIAKADFVPLPEDPPFGSGDFRKALFVVCLDWDWYCEGVWPITVTDPQDELRTLTLNFGKDFRCDYVVPGTIYGVVPQTGLPLQSTTGGFVYDDRPQLKAIARMTYEWYGTIRKAVSFETSRVNSDLQLGQLLLKVGDPTATGDVLITGIDSVITSIEIQIPFEEGEGDLQLATPKMTYETAFGELDQIKYVSMYAMRRGHERGYHS